MGIFFKMLALVWCFSSVQAHDEGGGLFRLFKRRTPPPPVEKFEPAKRKNRPPSDSPTGLPCKLPKNIDPPKIVLIGERHDLPSTSISHNLMMKDSKAGECIFGKEGLCCDQENDGTLCEDDRVYWAQHPAFNERMHGIEDRFIFPLALLTEAYIKRLGDPETQLLMAQAPEKKTSIEARIRSNKIGPILAIRKNDLVKTAYEMTVAQYKGISTKSDLGRLFALIQKTIEDDSVLTSRDRLAALKLSHPLFKETEKVLGFWKTFAGNLMDIGEADYRSRGIKLPANYREITKNAFENASVDPILDKEGNVISPSFDSEIKIALRNHFWADNILYLYCEEALKNPPRDLKVAVGLSHVNGLLKNLQRALGKTVPLETFYVRRNVSKSVLKRDKEGLPISSSEILKPYDPEQFKDVFRELFKE
jgi:hypothetical protein